MSEKPQQTIPIWFFVGVLLAAYGVLILGAGIYGLFYPPDVVMPTVDLGFWQGKIHLSLWWGALLLGIGAFYTVRFRPRRE
jgi:hypothetical protein